MRRSTHDEGWQFIQLGKFLERADKTLRILDIQYHLLRELTNPADVPLAQPALGGRAHELPGVRSRIRRLYVGRSSRSASSSSCCCEPPFPARCAFRLEAAARALDAIESQSGSRELNRADRSWD